MTPASRHVRRAAGRMVRLGLLSAARASRAINVAWGVSTEHPYIDLTKGVFHRVPRGAPDSSVKRSPPVKLSARQLRMVREWYRQDGPGTRFCIGGPGDQPYRILTAHIFTRVMRAVGIERASFHTVRHSVVTELLHEGVSTTATAALAGMTIATLETHYAHCIDETLAPRAHDATDRFLERGFDAGLGAGDEEEDDDTVL